MWSGGWGSKPPKKAKVTGIELCENQNDTNGINVREIDIKDLNRSVFMLDNGHWAYGVQIEPIEKPTCEHSAGMNATADNGYWEITQKKEETTLILMCDDPKEESQTKLFKIANLADARLLCYNLKLRGYTNFQLIRGEPVSDWI